MANREGVRNYRHRVILIGTAIERLADSEVPDREHEQEGRRYLLRCLDAMAASCVGRESPALRFRAMAYVLGQELLDANLMNRGPHQRLLLDLGVDVVHRALGPGFAGFLQGDRRIGTDGEGRNA